MDECESTPCQNDGHCTEGGIGAYTCECARTGYEGDNCVDDADECISSPCDGACTESTADTTVDVGTYYCSYSAGYSGFSCDVNVDGCILSPCQHDGQCQRGERLQLRLCRAHSRQKL